MPTMQQLGKLEEARSDLKEIPHHAFSAFESLARGDYLAVRAEMVTIKSSCVFIDDVCAMMIKEGD